MVPARSPRAGRHRRRRTANHADGHDRCDNHRTAAIPTKRRRTYTRRCCAAAPDRFRSPAAPDARGSARRARRTARVAPDDLPDSDLPASGCRDEATGRAGASATHADRAGSRRDRPGTGRASPIPAAARSCASTPVPGRRTAQHGADPRAAATRWRAARSRPDRRGPQHRSVPPMPRPPPHARRIAAPRPPPSPPRSRRARAATPRSRARADPQHRPTPRAHWPRADAVRHPVRGRARERAQPPHAPVRPHSSAPPPRPLPTQAPASHRPTPAPRRHPRSASSATAPGRGARSHSPRACRSPTGTRPPPHRDPPFPATRARAPARSLARSIPWRGHGRTPPPRRRNRRDRRASRRDYAPPPRFRAVPRRRGHTGSRRRADRPPPSPAGPAPSPRMRSLRPGNHQHRERQCADTRTDRLVVIGGEERRMVARHRFALRLVGGQGRGIIAADREIH